MTDRPKNQPFDERTALGELERFRSEIERYRRQRQAVHQELEQFVSSFPSPESVFPPERPDVSGAKRPETEVATDRPVSLPPVPPRPAVPPISPVQPKAAPSAAVPARSEATTATVKGPPLSTATEERTRPPVATPKLDPLPNVEPKPSTPKRSRVPVLILLVVLATAAGLWIWNAQRARPQQEGAGTAAPVQQAPAATRPAETTPPPTPAAITGSVLTTVRPAWVRVIADGERVVERELAADTRVPFNAEKMIVIRTGDAGAVRLSIRGEDQGPLGRDGQVVTRTFTVPVKTPR